MFHAKTVIALLLALLTGSPLCCCTARAMDSSPPAEHACCHSAPGKKKDGGEHTECQCKPTAQAAADQDHRVVLAWAGDFVPPPDFVVAPVLRQALEERVPAYGADWHPPPEGNPFARWMRWLL